MIYAYIRVSSKTQNIARQLEAISEYNLSKKQIYIDKESGKDFNRKNYQLMVRKLKKGDLVIIKSIDRLGRNYNQIIEEWARITKKKKADVKVLDMPLLNTYSDISGGLYGQFISDLVLQILSFVAENERKNIRERQAEGIRIAKERGVKFGRPPKELPDNKDDLLEKYLKGEFRLKEILDLLDISRGKFYRLLHEYKTNI